MQLYSTNNKNYRVSLAEAVLMGLPPDNGLFMPTHIPTMPADFWQQLGQKSLSDLAFDLSYTLLGDAIPAADLRRIVDTAINFPAPVVRLDEQRYILELFHGPSLAFKDFGARFMAQVMSYFDRHNDSKLVVLVATSGDTGGAVAYGFYQTEGIEVVILYPSGKVSDLQEKQLTTLGHNIRALEISGTFDDCQALVKQAFLDPALNATIRFTSANSINIARLIPQMFYYVEAYKQLQHTGKAVTFVVPSGNFGNLTAGLLAQRMGLPVKHFVAATNVNDIVPQYLATGNYLPRPSMRTLSNAMDVGAPSNFARMQDLYGGEWAAMIAQVKGYAYSDAQTADMVRRVYAQHGYVIDPHGAVGCLAADDYLRLHPDALTVILETAHPAKFKPDMDAILQMDTPVPDRLATLITQPKVATPIPPDFQVFKKWLLENC